MTRPCASSLAVSLGTLLVEIGPASAQVSPSQAPSATARNLLAVASDGSTLRLGEVTGRIEISPALRASSRFGSIRVRAGLEFEARATPDSAVPAYAVGSLGGVLRVVDGTRSAWVMALHRAGSALRVRIVLGDTTLEGVPVGPRGVRIEGAAPIPAGLEWSEGTMAVRTGLTRLCVSPSRGCVDLRNTAALPVREVGRSGLWSRVRAVAPGVVLEGWVVTSGLDRGESVGLGWSAGSAGGISDGCPYEGRPALVAPRTPVHVRPGGPVWARIPDRPDSVWAHDTAPDSPWIELTFARGVQRAFPATTCSTGWIARGSVTWDVLREGSLTLAREARDDRTGVVVREAPPWLLAAGMRPGDVILGRVARGMEYAPHDLDTLRRDLGIGGSFRVERGAAVRTLRLPLAAGCREPGMGQPAGCVPRLSSRAEFPMVAGRG